MQTNPTLSTVVDQVMHQSAAAFHHYRQVTSARRSEFLLNIREQILALGDELINTAAAEANLTTARLINERGRTLLQLQQLADMLHTNDWREIIQHIPPVNDPTAHPDIRRMLFPLGPVVVFGSSNFPFAYSTAGGDTASALAAGCSVVVKAHPAHPKTSRLVASAIQLAATTTGMPIHVFQHLEEGSFEAGKLLVQHPHTAAVGFTGSFSGGKALWDYAAARPSPIPVFAEMGSINPVLIFPDYLKTEHSKLAELYAGSITLGVGQFCTNPGLLIAIEGEGLYAFIEQLSTRLNTVPPSAMLHEGISKSYYNNSSKLLNVNKINQITSNKSLDNNDFAYPILATVDAQVFLAEPVLKEEVFGPFSLLVICKTAQQMMQVLESVQGQLTVSMMATQSDFISHADFIQAAIPVAGRLIHNGVPTGVEVCEAMVHGGPFPATTDSRFTAVGTQSVKRWLRPVAFQNFPENWLPPELQKGKD
ncbi:MAG: aldehyde dehydrogenase (NADP(+)) [Chitinophagaceae bacterium]|nr:aldehyde dehydrogenase (NADP(+)) [Chitinophagaceae bacterium]